VVQKEKKRISLQQGQNSFAKRAKAVCVNEGVSGFFGSFFFSLDPDVLLRIPSRPKLTAKL
jgi:hypothetical protein